MFSTILHHLVEAFITIFHFLAAHSFQSYISDKTSETTLDMKRKHILIIGGSFAGVSTAHRILKLAAKTPTIVPFKITLVTRDTHFYWNIAAPRAILPGQIPEEKMFQDIAQGFQGYPAGLVEVVIGTATGVDAEGKKAVVAVGEEGTKTLEFEYDILILGTGSQTKEATPFKSLGSTDATREGLRKYQEHIKMSKKIAIFGAGPTGVEVAGEVAGQYGGGKKVYLVSMFEIYAVKFAKVFGLVLSR